jgi:heat shock protein HslJ
MWKRSQGMSGLRRKAMAMATILFVAAAGGAGALRAQPGMADLAGTKWLADQIGEIRVTGNIQSTLEFDAMNRVSGKAGCNRFTGSAVQGGKTLAFGALASTRMMCPPAFMDQEQKFLKALASVRRFERPPNGKLLLFGDDAVPILRFSPL